MRKTNYIPGARLTVRHQKHDERVFRAGADTANMIVINILCDIYGWSDEEAQILMDKCEEMMDCMEEDTESWKKMQYEAKRRTGIDLIHRWETN